jgi:hypothetical protein
MSFMRLDEYNKKTGFSTGIATGSASGSGRGSGISDGDIPDNIRNFNGPGSINELKYIHMDNKSNFLITMNTNISYKDLDQEGRINLYRRTEAVMTEFGEKCKSGEFLKKFGVTNHGPMKAEVTKFDFSIEIGNQKGFMHAHSILCVEEKCHINISAAQKFVHDAYVDIHGPNVKGAYLNIRPFRDTQSVINAYLQKQQNQPQMAESF